MKKILSLIVCFLAFNCQILAKHKHKPKNNRVIPEPVVIVSIPKCGTHLLAKLIPFINNKKLRYAPTVTALYEKEMYILDPNNFYVTHAPCSQNNLLIADKTKAKIILCVRDPRDALVSYAYYLKKEYNYRTKNRLPLNHYNGTQTDWKLALLPRDEMITQFIKKSPFQGPEISKHTNIVEFYCQYVLWQENYPNILVTSFEKLVGPKGGGDPEMQIKEIKRIAQFLNVDITESRVKTICEKLFGGTGTFRAGRIGDWKDHLTNKQKDALKAMPGFNELLIELGYENDTHW